ncbi:outer membrane beta-barrel protein [Croceiramulus getboli]|nr:TonB-dependent receptor [Flavobacteriaceae bacterium YJPT1-3]
MQPSLSHFLLLLLFPCALWAQEITLSGSVQSTDGEPIAYANVLLLRAQDSVLVQGNFSEENGRFRMDKLDAGSYLIQASYVGYLLGYSDVFTLADQDYSIPPVLLKEDRALLEEVLITSRKPTVERKADRLVFNVENSIVSSGSSWEILKRTPGVIVNQGQLQVRGQGVTIYINDRRVQLSQQELTTLLENYSGSNVQSIEVITNPPARYEAEGGPILNIITSRNLAIGYKGNLEAKSTYAVFPKYQLGTSHYFKTNTLNLYASYSFNSGKFNKEDNSNINFIRSNRVFSRWETDFRRITQTDAHNANLILDYAWNDRNTLSLTSTATFVPGETYDNTSFTEIRSAANVLDSTFRTRSDLNNDTRNLAADLQYVHKFKKEGAQLSLGGHYTDYTFDRLQNARTRYRNADGALLQQIQFSTDARQAIEIYTGQLDLVLPFGSTTIEAGAKASFIDSRSKIDFFDVENPNSALEAANSDDFLYDEEVYAGYVSFAGDWDKWSVKTGVRAEQTESVGNSLVLNEVNALDYLEWFPTAYVQYQAHENHSFAIDYGRRIDRPRYQDLNPFAYFLNENNFDIGNPGLQPAFSHNFNFNYTLNGSYFFDLYYRDNGRYISRLPFQDNNNLTLRTVKQNVLESTSYGLDFSHGRYVTSGWYSYVYASLFHEDETFIAVESGGAPFTNEIDAVFAQWYNALSFKSLPNFSAEFTLTYISQFLSGSYVHESTTNVTVGLRQTLWNERAVLTLASEDLLGQANGRLTSNYLNQDNSFIAIPETQFIRFGFQYNFGNFRLSDNQRAIERQERERLQSQ